MPFDSQPAATERSHPITEVILRECWDFLVLSLCVLLLFRYFIAEPFQIPTGSMAPTLLGVHKEATCPHCGFTTAISASSEVDFYSGELLHQIASGRCGNCNHWLDLQHQPKQTGDRILVLKGPLAQHKRFDLVVFKHVGNPREYFVKRIVGLPGETVRINRGEMERFVPDENRWHVCRKSPELIQVVKNLVFDDRYSGEETRRWQASEGDWRVSADSYELTQANKTAELTYRHRASNGNPRLITDDVAYNSGLTETQQANLSTYSAPGAHPVPDLILQWKVQPSQQTRWIAVEFRVAQQTFRCQWDRPDDRFSLSCNGEQLWTGQGSGNAASRILQFGNVDRQLILWEGDAVLCCVPYSLHDAALHQFPSADDLFPVRVFAEGRGTRISELVLHRDMYYTRQSQMVDYLVPVSSEKMEDFLSDPGQWRRIREIRPGKQWTTDVGEYIVLGDNSPESQDSRHWPMRPAVPERMILGKVILPASPSSLLRLHKIR